MQASGGPTPPTPSERHAVDFIRALLSGEAPLAEVTQVMAPRVAIHMPPIHTHITPRSWRRWVRYLREQGTVSDLQVTMDEISRGSDGTVTAVGRWRGLRDGTPGESTPCTTRYRIVDGRVVEMWVALSDYRFPLGDTSARGLAATLLRASRWRLGNR
jgi:hypothetical protein